MNNVKFGTAYEKDGDVITVNVNADTFISSKKHVSLSDAPLDAELPSLFPIKHTISMPQVHIYDTNAVYRKLLVSCLHSFRSNYFFF